MEDRKKNRKKERKGRNEQTSKKIEEAGIGSGRKFIDTYTHNIHIRSTQSETGDWRLMQTRPNGTS